ncbi:hypothetical protein [Clostridium sp.]|uniref:hypothetical protein n=1 Tax=Clostridium sp. TaxID=1506 RepID=UPI003D6DA2AA
MIRLVCKKCDHIWYTANTSINQKCDECGGILIEIGIEAKEIENTSMMELSSNNVTS